MSKQDTVHIGLIRENEVALRAVNKDTEDYQGLRDSIKQIGLLNPINVIPSGETPGTYELVDGLHRFTACKELGIEQIPVHILDINEGQVALAQVMANVHKIETKPVEYTRQLIRIFGSHPTWTQNTLAENLGVSSKFISDRLNLAKLSPEVGKLVDDGKICLSNAYPLAKLPVAEQMNFIDTAMTMPPTEFGPTVNARIKEIRDAAKQGRAANDVGFVPVQHLRKMPEIKSAFENPGDVTDLAVSAGLTSPTDVAKFILGWVLTSDPTSLAAAKDKYDARRKELADAKAKRDAERQAKKDAAAAKAAAEAEVVV